MGCLFGQAKKNQDIEMNQVDLADTISNHPFNTKNDVKFLGYPKYFELNSFLNTVLEQNTQLWAQYKDSLLLHYRNIDRYIIVLDCIIGAQNQQVKPGDLALELDEVPSNFNLNFQNCLILDIQSGVIKNQIANAKYSVEVLLKDIRFKTIEQDANTILQWDEACIFDSEYKQDQLVSISLINTLNGSKIGSSQTFLFEEFKDQQIHQKSIKIRNNNDILAIIQIKQNRYKTRAQWIHDLLAFAKWWRQDLQCRKEQIDRMIQKINSDPEGISEANYQSLMSISNRLPNETVYEIPYNIK